MAAELKDLRSTMELVVEQLGKLVALSGQQSRPRQKSRSRARLNLSTSKIRNSAQSQNPGRRLGQKSD
jgi:hypothetical protein